MNHQSRFDAGYRKPGAGALGWPREMLWGGRWEGAFRIGNKCTPLADACWCMAKPIQYCKVKKKKIIIKKKEKKNEGLAFVSTVKDTHTCYLIDPHNDLGKYTVSHLRSCIHGRSPAASNVPVQTQPRGDVLHQMTPSQPSRSSLVSCKCRWGSKITRIPSLAGFGNLSWLLRKPAVHLRTQETGKLCESSGDEWISLALYDPVYS